MKRLLMLIPLFISVGVFGQTHAPSTVDQTGSIRQVSNLVEDPVQIIHNPSTRIITVMDMKPNTWVSVYDSMGRLAFQKNSSNGSIGISTSFWPAGVYHVVVQTAQNRVSKKFLIS